jgi:hypothetical protein
MCIIVEVRTSMQGLQNRYQWQNQSGPIWSKAGKPKKPVEIRLSKLFELKPVSTYKSVWTVY